MKKKFTIDIEIVLRDFFLNFLCYKNMYYDNKDKFFSDFIKNAKNSNSSREYVMFLRRI